MWNLVFQSIRLYRSIIRVRLLDSVAMKQAYALQAGPLTSPKSHVALNSCYIPSVMLFPHLNDTAPHTNFRIM